MTLKTELITKTVAPEVAIIRFSSDLDSSSITEVSESFEKLMQQDKTYIIIDMTGVRFLCSAILGVFMGSRKRLVQRGGDLVFAGLTLELKNKLTLMDANKIFTFFGDVRSASNAYRWEFQNKVDTITLSFPSFINMVPPVRSFVSRLAGKKGYGSRDAFRIETIVDEVCNNAVEHGKPGKEHEIKLILNIDKTKLDINVINESDYEKVKTLKALLNVDQSNVTPVNYEKRGRGLALIKMLSNDLQVDTTEHGTNVRVIKIREE